jgi:hypothetical protein
MGSDDLFRKRKARKAEEFARKVAQKASGKRFLIVCEGTKTEPQYFTELLVDLKIPPQRVKIAPNDGNSPDRVVAHSLELQQVEIASGDGYDCVYCVFDRDKHTTFTSAVKRVKDLSDSGKPLKAITSTPCFEFWLLLHFDYSNAPFHAAGKKSIGDQAVSKLKTKPGFAKYAKGSKGTYNLLKPQLPEAIKNARKLRQVIGGPNLQHEANPWTNVDELVEALLKWPNL